MRLSDWSSDVGSSDLSSHVRPSSTSTRKRPSCWPNNASGLGVAFIVLTKVKKPVTAAATVNSAALAEAVSRAASKARSPAGSAYRASTSEPTMTAAVRLTARVATGRPQRIMGPGSPSTRGAAPPPNARPHTRKASAAATRTAGPARRNARAERWGVGAKVTPPAYVRGSGEKTEGRCRSIPPRRDVVVLLDGCLQLRARGDLDALARGDRDLLAGLRVAARACRRLDLLERDPTGDRDLAALGDCLGDGGEEGVEHARHGGLALTRRAGDARNEFGLGDGLVSHWVVLPGGRVATFRYIGRGLMPPVVGSTASNVSTDPRNSADSRPFDADPWA